MKLEKEIEHLTQMVFKMADVVETNLKYAIGLYKEFDEEKYELINDDVVDMHERLIEEMCLDIMIKERPYAKDLRVVTGILKLVEDLERLGDHAEDISTFSRKLVGVKSIEIPNFDSTVDLALEMVHDSVNSFVNKDDKLASEVIKKDDIIDESYDQIISYLINETEKGNCVPSFAIYMTLMIKYIERIADHAVNVAEWVIYISSGFHKDKMIF
ncbi:MAG: phosphate signaling complex protein PhoU [Bacilli bacterium]|nr:phosphate signaling complex protein PhoU [Bacillales bacterium]MDY2574857.1 phosphate signaling complex protein PhoU [Bacilli bacterium]